MVYDRRKYLTSIKDYRERLASRGPAFYDEIDEEIELKQCGHCRRILPLSGFYRDIRLVSGYTLWCKDCRVEYHFLYHNQRGIGYLLGMGLCFVCGEVDPLLLENHHIFGKKNSDLLISLCANHHRLMKYFPLSLIENAMA